jgi:hypothetical protein
MFVTVVSVPVNHEHRDSTIYEIKSETFLLSIIAGSPPAVLPLHNISRLLHRQRPNKRPSLTETFC